GARRDLPSFPTRRSSDLFEQVENFGRARQIGKIALLPVLGLVVFLVSAPSTFLGASARVFSPGEYFNRPAPFELIVSPGSTEVRSEEHTSELQSRENLVC